MDQAELRDQLRDGSTLAEIAQAQGVDVQVVIDALVAEAKAHLDEKVAEGDLTQEEADERLAEITERITDRVNDGGGRGGKGDQQDD
jgi:polyhydroxyalkanoate synthesis regulator phasin